MTHTPKMRTDPVKWSFRREETMRRIPNPVIFMCSRRPSGTFQSTGTGYILAWCSSFAKSEWKAKGQNILRLKYYLQVGLLTRTVEILNSILNQDYTSDTPNYIDLFYFLYTMNYCRWTHSPTFIFQVLSKLHFVVRSSLKPICFHFEKILIWNNNDIPLRRFIFEDATSPRG